MELEHAVLDRAKQGTAHNVILLLILLVQNSVTASAFVVAPPPSVVRQRLSLPDGCSAFRLLAEKDDTTSAKVRFSSSASAAADANPIDATLSWITSDIGSIVLGGVGLVLLLVGRLVLDANVMMDDSSDIAVQTRVNLLAVFAIGAVLLNGLSQLDVQSVLAEQVELQGSFVKEPVIAMHGVDEKQLSWVLSSITTATPADTAVLLVAMDGVWEPRAFKGTIPLNLLQKKADLPESTPIMDRFLQLPNDGSIRSESYLPTLQVLPGKKEFLNTLLPANTQAALLLPLQLGTQRATLLLGSNQARSFTPRDIAWCQTAASRLEQ